MTVTVSQLNVYPIKSTAAMPQLAAEVTPRGLQGDRLWMVVDENGKLISQRDKGAEKLALVETHMADPRIGGIFMSAAGMPDHVVNNPYMGLMSPADRKGDVLIDVTIHSGKAVGIEPDKNASQWFSDYLGRAVKLVRIPESHQRPLEAGYGREGDHVGYADGYPILVTSTASLNALRDHFPDTHRQLGMDRFRPNIVLDGLAPFEEDVIAAVKIGDVVLEFAKPCSRCVLTTVDPLTGVKDDQQQPLATLVKTRRGKADGLQGVFFGQNAIARGIRPVFKGSLGMIGVGDEVQVLSRREMHPALAQAALKFTPR